MQSERESLLEFLLDEFNATHPDAGYKPRFNDPEFHKLWFPLDAFLTTRQRAMTIEAAAEFGIDVYGPGWDKWFTAQSPEGTRIILRNPVNYRTTLPQLYRDAKIVVNRSPLNLQNAVQQRCFDVGACGGFILTEYKPVLERHFSIGEEIAVYENCEDLRGKIRFYLEHEDERLAMATRLHEKVLARHTWRRRADEMLGIAAEIFRL